MAAVSVIIPCRNTAAVVGEQLQALARQDYSGVFEVVVVDDGSTDGTAEVVERYRPLLPSLTVVRNRNSRNVAAARNLGVTHASGGLLLFCDADDVVSDGWVRAMVTALAEHEFVAGRSELTRLNPPWARGAREAPQQLALQDWDNPSYLKHAGGGNLAMTRRLYDRVGPFDEAHELRLNEAADYCFRVQLLGHRIGFNPDAVLHVRLRSTARGVFRQALGWGECSVAVNRKFAPYGMPRPRWGRSLASWLVVPLRLARVRSRAEFAQWCFRLGWRVGRARGSVQHRTLHF